MQKRDRQLLMVGRNLPPDQLTGFLLQCAHNRSRRGFNEALRPLQIETRHFGVLTMLASDLSFTQRQIADQLELDKSSVVLIMDDLERLGLAKRNRDPRDRRAHALQLTQRGRECLAKVNGVAEQLGHKIFAGISKRERLILDRVLTLIIQNCEIQPKAGEGIS